jgi:hypothetical protein
MRQEEKASRKGRSGRRGKEGLAAVHHPDRRGAAFACAYSERGSACKASFVRTALLAAAPLNVGQILGRAIWIGATGFRGVAAVARSISLLALFGQARLGTQHAECNAPPIRYSAKVQQNFSSFSSAHLITILAHVVVFLLMITTRYINVLICGFVPIALSSGLRGFGG